MTVRSLLVVLMLVCASAAPAAAQDQAPKEAVDASVAPAPAGDTSSASSRSEAATAAAREMVRMMFIDSGVISGAVEIVSVQQLPALVQSVRGSALYRSLSRRRRTAVDAYVESFGDLFGEVINAEMPEVLERATAGTLATYSDAELIEIAAFLRTETARAVIGSAMMAGLRAAAGNDTGRAEPTAGQLAEMDAFARTPAGRRFSETAIRWYEMLGQTFESELADVGPVLSERVQRDFCVVLESDCPRALRRQLGLN